MDIVMLLKKALIINFVFLILLLSIDIANYAILRNSDDPHIKCWNAITQNTFG